MSSFKEDWPKFQEAKTQILAISVDHIYAQRVFTASLGGLPFPVLADWDKKVARSYSVLDEEKGIARRSLFLVDGGGILRWKNERYDVRDPQQYAELLAVIARA